MSRLLPAPLLSLALFVGWLVLNRSLAPGHLLLAALVAVAVPLATRRLRPPASRVRRPLKLAALVLRVGGAVIVSGIDVLRGVLRARRRPPRGAFVVVPLALRDPHALAALAMITAVIPGTVWCEIAPDRSALRLHVFDLDDEARFVEAFKDRYERPLMEIFP